MVRQQRPVPAAAAPAAPADGGWFGGVGRLFGGGGPSGAAPAMAPPGGLPPPVAMGPAGGAALRVLPALPQNLRDFASFTLRTAEGAVVVRAR
eukprot:4082064-Prymnesium_polylepis.1